MIKTWQQRCEEHPDHDGIVSDGMIQARMQEEIDELRAQRQWKSLTDDEIALICGECAASTHQTDDLSYARAIEARLREKNT
jgi:hypothetical protein